MPVASVRLRASDSANVLVYLARSAVFKATLFSSAIGFAPPIEGVRFDQIYLAATTSASTAAGKSFGKGTPEAG